jgi:hypothetical protein
MNNHMGDKSLGNPMFPKYDIPGQEFYKKTFLLPKRESGIKQILYDCLAVSPLEGHTAARCDPQKDLVVGSSPVQISFREKLVDTRANAALAVIREQFVHNMTDMAGWFFCDFFKDLDLRRVRHKDHGIKKYPFHFSPCERITLRVYVLRDEVVMPY